MKTFASAVAEVREGLDDRGRDEALCFAASIASRKGCEKPATYQTACIGQFEKILAAAGLKAGRDYIVKAKPDRPGLVAWQPTAETTRFLASVRAAPAFESIVAAADGGADDATPQTPVYNGAPPVNPSALWNALGKILEGNPHVPRIVRETVESRMVAGHRVVLPPVWMLERLVAPLHQARLDGAPLHMFKPLDPDVRNVLEVPIVRHVKTREVLHGLSLLVEMPPVDMYFRPSESADRPNPLQGYFYQDADFAAEVDNPKSLIVASSAVLDLDGPQCVQAAAALADGGTAIATYIANMFTTAFGVNTRVLCLSVRSHHACDVGSVPDVMFRNPACPFASQLGPYDVVVNFVLRLSPSYLSPAVVDVPEFTVNPRPAPKFTGYVPPFAGARSGSRPAPGSLTRKDLGVLWRFAQKFWETDQGVMTRSGMSAWLDSHPSASVEAAPAFIRSKFLQFTFLTQLRNVWQASGKPLAVTPGEPPDIVRGVFPMMLAQTDFGWSTGKGILLDASVASGVFNYDGTPERWVDLQTVPDGDLIPAVVFATNVPADAVAGSAGDALRQRLELQAYRSFFSADKHTVANGDPVELVDYGAVCRHIAPDVATWVCGSSSVVPPTSIHVEFKHGSRGRLVVLVAFVGAAGRLALALSANSCGLATEFEFIVQAAHEPETVPASGPGDTAAAKAFVGLLVRQDRIRPAVGGAAVGPRPIFAAVPRARYLSADTYRVE